MFFPSLKLFVNKNKALKEIKVSLKYILFEPITLKGIPLLIDIYSFISLFFSEIFLIKDDAEFIFP